jgi:hypothetical protein
MGGDFVLGVMQAVDGEKDPRNLLVRLTNTKREEM